VDTFDDNNRESVEENNQQPIAARKYGDRIPERLIPRLLSNKANLEPLKNNWEFKDIWNEFKSGFGKVYKTAEDDLKHFGIFLKNHLKVVEHNKQFAAGRKSYSLKINQFGDLTTNEYKHQMNGFKRNYRDSLAKIHASSFLEPAFVQLPDSVDWRQKGYVTPVKDQKQCGSCWAFSTTGALEGQHFRKTKKLVSLSEQNLVDCSGSFGNQGCNGGLMDQAFQYIKSNDGIDTEISYPYEAKDARCRFKKATIGADDTGFVDVTSGNETALQIAIATVGPVSVAIDAGHSSFQFYSTGVYNEPDCSPDQLDHGVLAVGYGTENGQDYWIVKNSWNVSWGQKGYILMARNEENMCGIATSASYPLV